MVHSILLLGKNIPCLTLIIWVVIERMQQNFGMICNNEECNPQYFDLKVDLGGEMFETPSTIADTINDQLNTSDEYSKNSPYVVDTMLQFQKLEHS